jgi:hypothetical protein
MANAVGRGLRKRRSKKIEEEAPEVVEDVVANPDEVAYSEDNTEAVPPTDTIDSSQETDMTSTYWDQDTDTEQEQAVDGGDGGSEQAEFDFDSADWASQVEVLPEDYKPSRPSAGRKRQPTPFDQLVLDVVGQGYRSIPFHNDAEAQAIAKALRKATAFHSLGMDLTINSETGRVEFQTRAKQDRRRKSDAEGVDTASVDANSDPDA